MSCGEKKRGSGENAPFVEKVKNAGEKKSFLSKQHLAIFLISYPKMFVDAVEWMFGRFWCFQSVGLSTYKT